MDGASDFHLDLLLGITAYKDNADDSGVYITHFSWCTIRTCQTLTTLFSLVLITKQLAYKQLWIGKKRVKHT